MNIKKHFKKFKCLFLLLIFFQNPISAQKIGVVLSGGAASGIAHIGVLKALEENHIPIDYITGTSMGALVGSLYAAGLSPKQIEEFVKSERFKNMSEGTIDEKYAYYFKHNDDNSSWITYPLSFDSAITTTLPTNVISSISMDFGIMETSGGPSATAKYNFDSLFIPFRCVASDVEKKESVIFKQGDLGQAVRASMSYPFYIPPIKVDGKLLFDGGLYNNFPANIMYEDFFPDFIIGSNLGSNSPPPKEDNLFSQIRSMLKAKTNYNILCEGGVIIEPKTEVNLFNFSNLQPIIDSGYAATMRKMEFIKKFTERRADSVELEKKRVNFKKREPEIIFDNITIEGLNKNQSDYAKKILLHKNKSVSLEELKEGYFRLASDNKIKNIFPIAKFNERTGFYDLNLKIKKERDIITYFGGNFSNRPISEGFIGLKYNYLGRFASEIMANAYFGKLYSSIQIKTRLDFPYKIPIYIEPNFTWNKWDYYKSSNAFLEDVKPAYLKQVEEFGDVNIGFPTGKKGRIVGGATLANISYLYYQTTQFTQQDTTDRTDFKMITTQAYYELNSLNRKQYANQGENLILKIRYVNGGEKNIPGSTSTDKIKEFKKHHEWITLKLTAERYFNRKGTLKIGFLGEGVYSTQNLFHNYTSSILAAPAFQPTPDSKTIFLENYRAYKYIAAGIKFVISIRKNIDLRAEGYIFQPYQSLVKTADLNTEYSQPFAFQHFISTTALVWHTPVGPMSLGVNYYDHIKNPFSILFHFGYIMFNKRALD
jgi:NTE family protein